jgi:molybdopterin converting factor small subunit
VILQIRYLAQLRLAAGRSAEAVEVEEGCTVARLAAHLAETRPELRSVLASPTLLTFVGDEQARPGQILRAGDEIILMTPIAGGDGPSALR